MQENCIFLLFGECTNGVPCQELLKGVLNETFIERTGTKKKSIVQRTVKEIDRGVDIDVPSQRALRDRNPQDLANTFASRIEPAVAKGRGKLRIGLGFGHKRADEISSRAAKEGRL